MKIMDIIKREVRKYPRYDSRQVIDMILPYQYVSFDVFDTLIKRSTIDPGGVFDLLGIVHCDSAFREKRIQAEREARKKAIAQGREEICVKDIYVCMPSPYCNDIDYWIDIELDMELSVCYCNQTAKEVYDWCVEKKKHILITSDMYIPKSFLIQLLKKCGYNNYESIYLSSEKGVKKRTGNLYKVILEDYNIDAKNIVHVGDTFKSDYVMAKRAEMEAVLLARNNRGLTKFCSSRGVEKAEKAKYSELVDFIQNHISSAWDDYFQFGYEAFGPLLYGFTKWLYQDVTEKGIKKIFFFSRDGYILQKAFREMYGDAVENSYFYVSRRSLRVPQLWIHPDICDVVDSFPQVSMLTVRAFVKNLGLDVEDYQECASKYGFCADDVLMRKDITSNEKLRAFYEEIKADVIRNSKREFDLLVQYMKQEQFEGDIAVVDIGWRGSLQYFLHNIIKYTDIRVFMEGYYIGLTHNKWNEINAQGFIRDNESTGICDSLQGSIGLIEYIFVSQEGSCKMYRDEQTQIMPVLFDYEYVSNGKREVEADHARSLQSGALQFVRDAVAAGLDIDRKMACINLKNAGLNPSSTVCELFGDIRFLEEKPLFLAKPRPLVEYIKNPKAFKRDFFYSRWKIGFLKRMVKLPLPYRHLYELAKKTVG